LRLLLDTHVAIWAVTQLQLLPPSIASALEKNRDTIFVSSVTILEISIKHRLKKWDSPPFSGTQAMAYFEGVGFRFLPVTAEHAAAVDMLPFHHKDPFDRLLVAQAAIEPMYLVSRDPLLTLYDCPRLDWQP
jgi:PIN domain nuclease of toxin-antitoxin system